MENNKIQVPDTFFSSDNEYGIPVLDPRLQADAFDLPIVTWGAQKRDTQGGTITFYVDDNRFADLWKHPDKIVKLNPVSVVEPNFSVLKDFPLILAGYETYRKRWLARYWQWCGIRIFVDLNVNENYKELNLLGVPKGWKAFATRGYDTRIWALEDELNTAKAIAGDVMLSFLVYGGGAKVKEFCRAHATDGVYYSQAFIDRDRSRKPKQNRLGQQTAVALSGSSAQTARGLEFPRDGRAATVPEICWFC